MGFWHALLHGLEVFFIVVCLARIQHVWKALGVVAGLVDAKFGMADVNFKVLEDRIMSIFGLPHKENVDEKDIN